jgi:circadian clock protein KaiB
MARTVRYRFRLYIAGGAPKSHEAIANLYDLCRIHLPDRHVIEIVDVSREQARAMADRVIMTPTLIKLSPAPVRRIVGTLSDRAPVLQALGLWNHDNAQQESLRSPARVLDDD